MKVFWGRRRWARKKLREVIERNHGKKFGLYRAKVTRFAGKYREMSRMLRCKADLQQVVVSSEYNAQRVARATRQEEDNGEDHLDVDSFRVAKAIVLDEEFWLSLVVCLRVSLPLVRLLRMLDSNKPVLGKVYDRMFLTMQKLEKAQGVPWLAQVRAIHARRWEYLHSDMHVAAYALDPEFMQTVGDLDEATQNGLLRVFEKMCLRDAILESHNPQVAAQTLNLKSPEVVQRVAEVERQFAHYQDPQGAFARSAVSINAKMLDPATWWRMYGKKFPLLCKFAQAILAQVGSASCCERNWSVYGRIRQGRSRLGHSKSDMLVYAHEAIALHTKLLSADYEVDFQPWEGVSDSDSDVSSECDLTVEIGEEELRQLAR